MDRRVTEKEVRKKYKHFTERKMPFEDHIVEVLASDNIFYSDRWNFLKSIYLITSKGYYLTYNDICGPNSHCVDEEQPYDVFLDGVIKCAYCYAFNVELEEALHYIRKLLSVGKICVNNYYIRHQKQEGQYCFCFTVPWYSWISEENRKN